MKMFFDDWNFFFYFYHSRLWPIVNIDKNILESSENIFMNFPPYVFDVDNVAKIRLGLSITVLKCKFHKITAEKSV